MLARAGFAPFPFQQQWPSHKLNKLILYHPANRDRINKLYKALKREKRKCYLFKDVPVGAPY